MAVPRNGLLAEYLGDISGSQLTDTSGNEYHGTVSGSVSEVASGHPCGPALDFAGGHVDLPTSAMVTGDGARTVAFWFYRATTVSGTPEVVYISGTESECNAFGTILRDDGKTRFAGWAGCDIDSDVDYAGAWTLLIYAYDGSKVYGYANTSTLFSTTTSLNTGSTSHILGNKTDGSRPFSGKLARVRIYNRVISAAERYQLYMEAQPFGRCSFPHAIRLSARCSFPHALRPLEVPCSFPHGMARVDAHCSFPHALRHSVSVGCSFPHSLLTLASVSCSFPHALLGMTPVTARCAFPHAMYDPDADFAPDVTVTIDGRDMDLLALELTADEQAFALQAGLTLAHLDDWLRVSSGMSLQLQIGTETVELITDEKTRNREFGKQVFTVTASSPASRLAAPHAAPLTRSWTDTAVEDIALELCALADVPTPLTLDWRICNWTLSRFDVEGQTPMEALATLATQASRVVSAPDGTVVVQYHYPLSPARYARETPDVTFSDYDDITRLEQESDARPCYDRVDVFNESAGTQDVLALQEWKGPGGDEDFRLPRDKRMVAAFTWPVESVELITTGCESTVYPQGVEEFEHEELVEFTDGQGSLSYPALELLDWTWSCEDLGDVSSTGNSVQSETVAPGCSLCLVRYRSRCQLFIVESRSLEPVQVYAQLQGDAAEATQPEGLVLTVQRGGGERPSPQMIVDALCRSRTIMRQRGRNYLDTQGYMKERYEIVTPPRTLQLPGALALVRDGSLRENWRAKVTGWSLTQSSEPPEASVRWLLERSLQAEN